MNKPLPSRLFRSYLANLVATSLVGGLITVAVGCGGSDSAESPVVTPPSPTGETTETTEPTEPAESDAPGELELPTGEIPPTGDAPTTDQPSGLEMPADVEIPDTGSTDSAADPPVRYATWEAIQSEVKSTGKVTVVDLWSLACEPCLKEFPGLVELHQSHGADVHCVAVDLDYDGRKSRPPNYYEQNVVSFLESVQASGFPTFISETPSDDVFAATELISIPAVLVYDESGALVKTFVDAGAGAGFTYHDDVTPFVQQLAKK